VLPNGANAVEATKDLQWEALQELEALKVTASS